MATRKAMKSFNSFASNILLLDLNNVIYRSFYATERDGLINSNNVNVGFILGLAKVIRSLVNRAKNESGFPNLVIAEDRPPRRKRFLYRRYQDALSDYSADKSWDGKNENERIRYKGNREKSEIDYNPIEISKQYLECLKCNFIWCEDEEADDVIASYIHQHKKYNIFVSSTDKDLWQLLPHFPNLKIILGDGSEPDKEKCLKHFDTTDFKKIALHKIIRGDSGDNVKSINRFQFKKNLDVFNNCDGTTEDFMRKLIEKDGEHGKDTERFMKYLKVAILNDQVVRLKTDLKLEHRSIKKANIDNWNKLCVTFETPSLFSSPLLKIL